MKQFVAIFSKKIMDLGLIIALLSVSILSAQAQYIPPADQQVWDKFQNHRFGVYADVPLIGFVAQPEPANGDGRAFLSESGDITISVFGSHWNILSEVFSDYREQQRQMLLEQGAEITYAPGGRTWFVFSGYLDNQIFYFKSITRPKCSEAGHIYFLFPKNEKSLMSPIIEHMEDSFGMGTSVGCPFRNN